MKLLKAIVLVALAACVSAQSINETAILDVLSGFTGGDKKGLPSKDYLTTMATTLAAGFMSSIDNAVGNISAVISDPSSYATVLAGLEDEFCRPAYMNHSVLKPASISGPEIRLEFSGGACILNEVGILAKTGPLGVDCLAPAVTVEVIPAKLTSPYKTRYQFKDKECKLQKQFGQYEDNVVFVIDKGIFDIPHLVSKVKDGLTDILGGFSSLKEDVKDGVASSPSVAPILQTVNAATALFGK